MSHDTDAAIPLHRAPTDLRALFASTTEALSEQARELDVDFRIEAAPDLPEVAVIDPEKIAWAVATLVGNAFRYVRRGTRRLPGGSIRIALALDAQANEIVITVEDDGPGIPADKVPWLFKRQAGTVHAAGLGLRLIHDIVVAHGGTAAVESRVGGHQHGTKVTLRFPWVRS